MKKIRDFWKLVIRAFVHFRNNQPLMLASSTAFFTTFSLPPIVILVVNILSFYFFQADRIRSRVYTQLELTFGPASAHQISSIAENFRSLANNAFYTIAGTIFLVFIATTLFYVVQSAIHQLWSIKHNENRKLKHRLIQRGIALLMIIIGSVLMLVTLIAEAIIRFIGDYVGQMYPQLNEVLILILGLALSLIIFSVWFAVLFRYLPDARIPFNTALKGGIFTAVLFSIGKYLLGLLLVTDRIGDIFGASASIMILLLFIFYSSMIIYFGASFTYMLIKRNGQSLRTKKYSEHIPD